MLRVEDEFTVNKALKKRELLAFLLKVCLTCRRPKDRPVLAWRHAGVLLKQRFLTL